MNLNLTQIICEDRLRDFDQDHIEELKESISDKGLMQPIVVVEQEGDTYRLVAGGHRLESFRQLGESQIPCVLLEDFLRQQGKLDDNTHLTKSQLLQYEIEENVKRLSMSWQDRVLAVEKYHKMSEREAIKSGDTWLQSQTGSLLGIDQSYVSRFLVLAKRLRSEPEGAIASAGTVRDAIKLLLQEKLEQTQKKQIDLLKRKRQEVQAKASTTGVELDKLRVSAAASDGGDQVDSGGEETTQGESEKITKEDIYGLYYHGDALDTLREVAKVKKINHIITDPPYGIDMDNLKQKNIEKVAATHQVEPNVALLMAFLDVAYEVIDPKGFLCMWYDLDHHEKLINRAKEIGWKPCRWPFVWCKSSSCANQAAAYNFTKSTEVCMILRRSEESVLVQKQPNNFIVTPNTNDSGHPFHKPAPVWGRLIEAVSYEGQTIVDPFAGTGSCMSAAFSLGRDPVGIEIDEPHIHEGVTWMHKVHNEVFFHDSVL
jgi:ParB-like chromosome segregation protein Spo0J